MTRHNTTLDTHTVTTLRAYGGGNLSQGIRRASELVNASQTTTGSEGVTWPNWVTHHGCGRPENIETDQWVLFQVRTGALCVRRSGWADWEHDEDARDIMVYTVIEQRKGEEK